MRAKNNSEFTEKHYLEQEEEFSKTMKELISDSLDNVDDIDSDNTVEEIESKRRDGFIPHSFNCGGWTVRAFKYVSSIRGSGCSFSSDEANSKIDELIDYSLKLGRDEFIDQNRDKLKEKNIPEESVNYSDLYDLGHGELAELLDEFETAGLDEDTVMLEVRCMYHGVDEEGIHSASVDAAINWETPYHRSGKNNEVYVEQEIEFSTVDELKANLSSAIKKVTAIF